MQIEHTKLAGALLITPKRFGDARGFFAETWNRARMAEAGVDIDFVQDNHSLSEHANTLRGLHCQSAPFGQAKLVRCGRGRLWDVAVDMRAGSVTYGQWIGIELSAENGRQFLIPEGFLHGFITLEPNTEIVYKCSQYYAPEHEHAIAWDDPDLAIDWPISGAPIVSERDAAARPSQGFTLNTGAAQ